MIHLMRGGQVIDPADNIDAANRIAAGSIHKL
jgi:hypothetical protein